ncbi:N/A [soil metagenome]
MIDPAQDTPALTVPVTPMIQVNPTTGPLTPPATPAQPGPIVEAVTPLASPSNSSPAPKVEISKEAIDTNINSLPAGLSVSPVAEADGSAQDLSPAVASTPLNTTPGPTKAPVPETLPNLPDFDPNLTSPAATGKSVLDILMDQGSVTKQQLDELEMEQASTGKSIESIIEDKNVVSPLVLTQAKAKLYNIPFAQLAEIGVSPEAISLVPESVAHRYQILPFLVNKQDQTLAVAMRNPLDLSAIDFVEKKTGYKILPYFATPEEIAQTIAERYAQNLSSEVTAALKDSKLVDKEKNLENLSMLSKEVIREAPITKIVETILGYAIKARASDIHIEPQEDRTRIRYRVDGILSEKLILPRSVHDAVLSRIKILSDMKIDEKRIPQDGRFTFVADGEEVDLRVSTLPTVYGEKVVMRLLKKNAAIPSLEDLGLWGQALTDVKECIKIPHGIILITGPTGSGKTTTLYSILHILNTAKVNISTLEDPVEYQIAGVNQVQVNPQAGLTFASGLRAFLRQDPNIIMVGEIRDGETAELAIQASLTGHLVFSTIHTNSAAGAIPRLTDIGAEPFLVASSLTLSLGQRVVRILNADYKEEYKPEQVVVDDIKKVLGAQFEAWCTRNKKDPNNITLFRAKKDRPSAEPDYKGRMAIFEVLRVTEEISRMILEKKPEGDIEKAAIKNGMLLMKQDGYLKALEGKTTIEEVLRVADI